ncbi:MAG TPA: hypothetical protein VJS91_10610, partial [Nitrososphaeraceae archaeon]|nr:hypothetical protein [Nitrososphaeraceae archaeon]
KLDSSNLLRIRQLHGESHSIATFYDNVTRNDNGMYPNNIFSIMIANENRPLGEIVIKRNY